MNFLNLEYFIALVEAGNISRAAAQLYVSQQTLSENLAKLEREIGTPLFNRGRQIALTPAGKRFYTFSENVLKEKKNMNHEIRQLIDSKTKIISCGVATYEAPLFLSNLLVGFYEAYPDYRVAIHTQKDDSSRSENNPNLDFVFNDIELDGTIQLSDSVWNYEYLSRSSVYAIVARKSLFLRIYGEKWPEVEKRLLSERSVSVIHELPLCTVRNKKNLHYRTIIKAFELSGLQPNISFQADMNRLINDMCMEGMAAYFGPEGLCKLKSATAFNDPELYMYSIDVPGLYNGLAISYSKKKTLTNVDRKFIELSKKFIV